MAFMKWGAKRRRSKPIYNRRASYDAQRMLIGKHLQWRDRLEALKHLRYPTAKKSASIGRYIRKSLHYPKKFYRTGYRVNTYKRARARRR